MNTDETNYISDIEKLRIYIQQQIHTGLRPDEIAAHLRIAGWSEELINNAFLKVQAQVMPSPVVTQPVIPNTGTLESPIEQTTVVSNQLFQSQNVAAPAQKRGRIKTGWLLLKQSLKVLRQHEGLTRYIIVSAFFSLVLTIIIVLIFIFGQNMLLASSVTNGIKNYNLTSLGYLTAFVYYVLAFFIINFYTAGLTANILDLFQGNSHPYGHYMKKARSRGGTIFIFSLIEATIGTILRLIAERSRLLGFIVSKILGTLWSIARLFVIPIIVSSDKNSFAAIKQSILLLKATWGENIVGRATFGIIISIVYIFLLLPISFVLILIGVSIGHLIGGIIAVILVISLFLVFSIIISAASSVLNTALFYFAQYKMIPPAFDPDLLNSVFINRKKRRGLFGPKV